MESNENVNRAVQLVAEHSIEKSSEVLTKMLNTTAKIELKNVNFVDITEITASVNQSDFEAIGSFILLSGDAPFKFLFYVQLEDAFILTDLFIGQKVGTTKAYDEYVSSTVQEIGNILSSAISNVFASDFQIKMLPEPPSVIRDFSGTLFSELIMDMALQEDKILLIESLFEIVETELNCHMYLLPIDGSERILGFGAGI